MIPGDSLFGKNRENSRRESLQSNNGANPTRSLTDAAFRPPIHAHLETAAKGRHISSMAFAPKSLPVEDAISPAGLEPSEDVKAWQAEKIGRGLRDADEGRFASKETVKAIIQKFIPNG